jgi:hypothetical protein
MESIKRVVSTLCATLEIVADKNDVCRVDNLFSEMTIGVICEMAFDLKMTTFEGEASECSVITKSVLDMFAVRIFSSIESAVQLRCFAF